MKAIICTKYGAPEVLQLIDTGKPVAGNNEVLIKVKATSVTASDCIIRSLNVPFVLKMIIRIVIGFTKPRNPILGMSLSGVVETIGSRVTNLKTGDEVFGFNRFEFGTYAEYVCWPASRPIYLKPSNISSQEAAAIPFGGLMALHFLRKARLSSGQKILIYGASGAIGTAAVQLARHFGAHVTGVCGTQNLELVSSLGAERVIDYTDENVPTVADTFDVIFDAVGRRKHSPFKALYKKSLSQNGIYLSVDDGTPKMRTEDLQYLANLVECGHIKAVIDRCYPLEKMVDAHRYVDKGHKKGAVVVSLVNDDD